MLYVYRSTIEHVSIQFLLLGTTVVNLNDVIEALVDERNLDRELIKEVVKLGVRAAYEKKYPSVAFELRINTKTAAVEVFAKKQVVSVVTDKDTEIALRKARTIDPSAELNAEFLEPFVEPIGRVEMLLAKQVIAQRIREVERQAVYNEFQDKLGTIVNGTVHKQERAGFVVSLGDTLALLPRSCAIPEEDIRVGYPIRALLKDVTMEPVGDYQLILDRTSTTFIERLLELEIPEIFEGLVDIKKIVRIPGYKSKVVVSSNKPEIDPAGTCIGIGGSRIKPILKELGVEKVDMIEETHDLEALVADALKPAEIDRVSVDEASNTAMVWLAYDQRAYAIGKLGKNKALACQLTGLEILFHEEKTTHELPELEARVSSPESSDDSSEEVDSL